MERDRRYAIYRKVIFSSYENVKFDLQVAQKGFCENGK